MRNAVAIAFVGLVAATASLGSRLTPWSLMWLLAFALFAIGKWLSFAHASDAAGKIAHPFLYLFAWVGMDPKPFREKTRAADLVGRGLAISGALTAALGIMLIISVRLVPPTWWLAQGWMICVGIVLLLHFGIFKVLTWILRRRGIAVEPIMNKPLLARSVSEFWGVRWNQAFRQLVFPFVYTPLKSRIGQVGAILSTFLLSGLIHDLLISVPARGGYGLPTIYFLLQPLGMFIERSKIFVVLNETIKRIFTYLVVAAPAALLFHPPFMRTVILPFAYSAGILEEVP